MDRNDKINMIVSDNLILQQLDSLRNSLREEVLFNSAAYSENIIKAIQESPNVNEWVKREVIPKFYEGDEGLKEILEQIKDEKFLLISATKLQIVIEMLYALEKSLEEIKTETEEGKYSIEDNIKFYDETVEFRTYH